MNADATPGIDAKDSESAWLFGALAALLIAAPLPLGGNRPWALALLASAVAVLLMLTWAALLLRGDSPVHRLRRARLPVLLLCGYATLVAAQWMAGPGSGVIVSVDPFATLQYLLRTLCCVGIFILVMLLARNPQRVRTLALVLVAAGVLQAAIGVWLSSVGATYSVLYEEVEHGARASGSFINSDHLSAYLYLCLSLGVGVLVGSLSTAPAPTRGARHLTIDLLDFMLSPRMALRIGLVVMVVALVLTRSRMGNAAFFFSLIVLGCAVAATTPALRVKAGALVASMLVIDLLIIGNWVGLDKVIQRIDDTAIAKEEAGREETLEQRLDASLFSLPMIAARPITGNGGGTFLTAFPAYKTREMAMYGIGFDHAHNDYVEIAVDTGLLGLALLGGVVLASIWRVRRMLSSQVRSQTARGIAYGVLMAVTAMLLHSLVDFSLQIPAIAMTFTTILALLWATPLQIGSKRQERRDEADASTGGRMNHSRPFADPTSNAMDRQMAHRKDDWRRRSGAAE